MEVGLDQVNISPLPQGLAGAGKVNVVVTPTGDHLESRHGRIPELRS